MNNYKAEFQNKYDNSHSFYNFVKFECTSTYPRLTFLIKFLPILNGVSLVHVYSQNKLSRSNDNETSISTNKNYKEIEIIYGSEIKNSNSIEFRYTEPKKLKEVEKFLTEFYLLNVNKCGMFFQQSINLKYFDNSFVLMIDEVVNQNNKANFENMITNINNRFYESYMNGGEIDKIKIIEKLNNGQTSVLQTGNTVVAFNVKSESASESRLDTSVKKGTNLNNNMKDVINMNNNYGQNIVSSNSDLSANGVINTNFMLITKQFILKEIFLNNGKMFHKSSPQSNGLDNNWYFNSKNEKDNTLILSKMDDIPMRQIETENECSYDFGKQLSEISKVELNDDDNYGIVQNFYKISNTNNSASFDILLSEIDKKNTIIDSNNKYESTPKNNDKNVSVSINKLNRSITNVDNKIKSNDFQNTYMKINSGKIPIASLNNINEVKKSLDDNEAFRDKVKNDELISEMTKLHDKVVFRNKIFMKNEKKDEEMKPITLREKNFPQEEFHNQINNNRRLSDIKLKNIYIGNHEGLDLDLPHEIENKLEIPNVVLTKNIKSEQSNDKATFK